MKTNPWTRIEDKAPPKGTEVVLYFPADARPNSVLRPMKTIGLYPCSFPRKPTLWMPLPEIPKELR